MNLVPFLEVLCTTLRSPVTPRNTPDPRTKALMVLDPRDIDGHSSDCISQIGVTCDFQSVAATLRFVEETNDDWEVAGRCTRVVSGDESKLLEIATCKIAACTLLQLQRQVIKTDTSVCIHCWLFDGLAQIRVEELRPSEVVRDRRRMYVSDQTRAYTVSCRCTVDGAWRGRLVIVGRRQD